MESAVFLAWLFLIENALFVLVGIPILVARFVLATRERAEAKLRPFEIQDEQRKALEDMRAEIASLREMLADLLLELDRQRRAVESASKPEKPAVPK